MSYIAALVGEGNTSRSQNMANPVNPVDVTQNPASPFFVHPGENPGLVLVTQPLNSKNYFSWSRSIKGSLIAKNKFCFVDGSLPLSVIPEQNQPAWHRCNQLVLSWIKHALSPSIAQSIIWFDTAAQKEQTTRQPSWFHPIIEELVEKLSKGELSKDEYPYVNDPSVTSNETSNAASPIHASSDSMLSHASSSSEEMGRLMFIFIVGGASRSEYRRSLPIYHETKAIDSAQRTRWMI